MRFLRCLAKAVVKHGAKFLCKLVPGGEFVYDVAADVVEEYRRDGREADLRAELQAMAQAPADKIHQEVGAAVEAEAAAQPPEVQQALTAYLTQVPAAIRRSLRRPSDPTGTTVPATLALSHPEDLMPFLPSRPPRFRPGDRPLPGVDWELEELVGVGGFGEVWKARHVHLRSKAPVALKFCLDRAAAPALRNEAGVLDQVMRHGCHPGIVPLLNTYLSAEPPCLEYEFVEGGDLAGLIQDLHGHGRMTLDLANRLFLRLVEIVAHTHRANPPIVHGDLKPANVLVRRGADGKIGLRVTDFGIGGLAAAQAARETRQPTRSRHELLTEAVRGAYTPLYASPEQMLRRKGEPADPRDDVHALGVIWYQLLTGDLGMMSVPPDWREQIEERGLSAQHVQLLASCVASKAAKRPTSAVVLVEKVGTAPSSHRIVPPEESDNSQGRTGTEPPGKTAMVLDGRWSGQYGDIWDFRGELDLENNVVEGRIRWTLIECPSSLRMWSKRIGESGVEWVEGSLERQQLVLRTREVSDSEFLGLNSYKIFISQGRETFEGTSVSLKSKEKGTVRGVIAIVRQRT
jgi:serine/threonine protein kinase